jgi:hypothetical protein
LYFSASDGRKQGRTAGRRLAVGFLQIVPGVFPPGWLLTHYFHPQITQDWRGFLFLFGLHYSEKGLY